MQTEKNQNKRKVTMTNKYPIRFFNLKKKETKYSKGHYKIWKFIMKQNANNISVSDIDIKKATKLGKNTVLVYRTKLLRDGIIIRNGSDFSSGRKRATWKCVKPLEQLQTVSVNKVKVQKIKPQLKTSDFQKGLQLFHQILKLVEKAIS